MGRSHEKLHILTRFSKYILHRNTPILLFSHSPFYQKSDPKTAGAVTETTNNKNIGMKKYVSFNVLSGDRFESHHADIHGPDAYRSAW